MALQTLEDVLSLLREVHRRKSPNSSGSKIKVSNRDLEIAIIHRCGKSPQTYTNNRATLLKLGWIEVENLKNVRLTDKDITESCSGFSVPLRDKGSQDIDTP